MSFKNIFHQISAKKKYCYPKSGKLKPLLLQTTSLPAIQAAETEKKQNILYNGLSSQDSNLLILAKTLFF